MPNVATNPRATLRCNHCRLVQFEREQCRRCRKQLVEPLPVVAEKVAQSLQIIVDAPLRRRERGEVTALSRAIGRTCQQLRGSDVTQRALAERAGVAPSFLSFVESGKANPSMRTVAAIARALGLTCATFMMLAERDIEESATVARLRFGPKSVRPREAFAQEMSA